MNTLALALLALLALALLGGAALFAVTLLTIVFSPFDDEALGQLDLTEDDVL